MEIDQDLLGVALVLGVLGVGIVGGIILLFMYAESVRKFFRCEKNEEEERKKEIQRRTIVIVRGKDVLNLQLEDGRRKAHHGHAHNTVSSPASVKTHQNLSRVFSAPTDHRPTAIEIEAKEREQRAVFIYNDGKSYKAGSVVSYTQSPSSESSYLPGQLPPARERRTSC